MKRKVLAILLGIVLLGCIFVVGLRFLAHHVDERVKATSAYKLREGFPDGTEFYLREITFVQWDRVKIWRRMLETAFETPDLSALEAFDSGFQSGEHLSLMVFYNGDQITDYVTWVSGNTDVPELYESDGETALRYASLSQEEAHFRTEQADGRIQWILCE